MGVALTLANVPLALAQEGGLGYTPMTPAAPLSPGELQRSVVPAPPMAPTAASRPASWPGSAPQASPWVPPDQRRQSNAQPDVPMNEMTPCTGARILARVGSDAILESEAIGAVNELIEANKDRIPPDQVEKQRELLIRQRLKGLIETKLIVQDARRTIPAEGWPQIEKQLSKQFEEVELEKMIKKSGVDSARDLDLKLRRLGTSLEREKRAFIDRSLAQQWVGQQIKRNEEITYDQMVSYYRDHVEEFTTPARAQWEELMVRYSKYPTREAAFEAIARMGNQILAGAPFAQIAKSGSDGIEATQGGRRDWTSKGSLDCEALDQALFTLPVGQMSPIIESPRGYHIIRVTRREDAAVHPFLEAQVDIKQKIMEDRWRKGVREYMEKLTARTPVWTAFDDSGLQQASRPQDRVRR
jgi:parvulin-like peptidyl-prolyl isomerase